MLKEMQILRVVLLITLSTLTFSACRAEKGEELPARLNLPLPSFLEFVAPAPKSEISIDSYNEGQHYPPISEAHPAPQDGRQRICSELLSRVLLEPEDYFAVSSQKGEFLPDRVTVYVDGAKVARDDEVIMVLSETVLEDENGRVIARAPASHLICWPAKLERGIHVVTMEVNKTSGEVVNYSWSFTLY
jgi:hypothetical protein